MHAFFLKLLFIVPCSIAMRYSLDTPALYIDDQIRDWVLFPITLVCYTFRIEQLIYGVGHDTCWST